MGSGWSSDDKACFVLLLPLFHQLVWGRPFELHTAVSWKDYEIQNSFSLLPSPNGFFACHANIVDCLQRHKHGNAWPQLRVWSHIFFRCVLNVDGLLWLLPSLCLSFPATSLWYQKGLCKLIKRRRSAWKLTFLARSVLWLLPEGTILIAPCLRASFSVCSASCFNLRLDLTHGRHWKHLAGNS